MSLVRSYSKQLFAWMQICGVGVIGIGVALTWFAALGVFVRGMPSYSIMVGIGFVAYLGIAGIGITLLRMVHRRFGNRVFLLVLLGASLFVQFGVVALSNPDWKGTIDAELFKQVLTQLHSGGYSQDTLAALSARYDYGIMTRRALPLYMPLKIFGGANFIRLAQCTQAILLALSLLLTWRIARLVFSEKVAFWASTFQFVMPQHWMGCLDLEHHIPGVFYFLCSLWILAEWIHLPPRRMRFWLCALGLGLLTTAMRLEGGMSKIYLASVFFLLSALITGGKAHWSFSIRSGFGLLIIPVLLSTLILLPLNRRIEQADEHRLASLVGYCGSAWSPDSKGGFSDPSVQLDVLTSAGEKKDALVSLLASRALYHPVALSVRLPFVKTVQFFLLGYASGAEEILRQNREADLGDLAKGARVAFLIGVLPFVGWGAWLLMPLLNSMKRLHLILPCILFAVGIIAVGEVSPRYSAYIHPFLFMLAALPLAWPARRRWLMSRTKKPGVIAVVSCMSALALILGMLYATRPVLRQHAFMDLRGWVGPAAQVMPASQDVVPIELRLHPKEVDGVPRWGPLQIPPAPDRPGQLTFYALRGPGAPHPTHGVRLITTYATDAGTIVQTNPFPSQIRLDIHPGMAGTLAWHTLPARSFPLRIGYASYSSEQDEP